MPSTMNHNYRVLTMAYLTAIRAFFSGALGKLALVALAVALLAGTVYYIIDLNNQVTTAKDEAKDWKTKFEGVDLNVKEVDKKQEVITGTFAGIDAKNVDLLCLARYGSTLPGFPQMSPITTTEPQIKAVAEYSAAKAVKPVTTTPATDKTLVTPAHITVANDPGVSDQIGIASLNNAWKAFCAVTDNTDETCAPFR